MAECASDDVQFEAQALQAELEALGATYTFDVPTGFTIPTILVEAHRNIQVFIDAHCAPTARTAFRDAEFPTEDSHCDWIPESDVDSWDSNSTTSSIADQPADIAPALPKCKHKGPSCSSKFHSSVIREFHRQYFQLTRSSRRPCVFGMLAVLTTPSATSVVVRSSSGGSKMRQKRCHTSYQLLGVPVCRRFFSQIVGGPQNGTKLVKTILRDIQGGVFRALPPKYAGGVAHAFSKTSRAFDWLQQFASLNGLCLPHARGAVGEHIVIQLPCVYNVSALHRLYTAELAQTQQPALSRTAFRAMWVNKLPWIRVADSYTDYCNLCYELKSRHMHQPLVDHLSYVVQQQVFIREMRRCALETFSNADLQSQTTWISSDFGQAIRLPSFGTYQPGASFYKTGLSVDLMAVCDELRLTSTMYFISEGHGHDHNDANQVISIWWHYMHAQPDNLSRGTVIFHADNTPAQVKNRFVVWFLLWLIRVSQAMSYGIKDIHAVFNVVGHTKFAPDRAFAMVKRAIQRRNVASPKALMTMAQCCPAITPVCSCSVPVYDWKRFLSGQFDRVIEGISQTHHWSISHENMDSVRTWVSQSVAHRDHSIPIRQPLLLPSELAQYEIPPTPLTAERRDYLQDIINTYTPIIDSDLLCCGCL
jgi:hypothetical protein